MIHGIYTRSRVKNKWRLFSVALSAESANIELKAASEEIRRGGNMEGIAAIQTFDSVFFIPELITEIKAQNVMLN